MLDANSLITSLSTVHFSLTDTEKRYAQIEKDAVNAVHAARKFHCYIFGKETIVYNDLCATRNYFFKTASILTHEIAKDAAQASVV